MTTTFTPLVKGFSFTTATTDTSGNPLPTGEAETNVTIGIRLDGDITHSSTNYQYLAIIQGAASSVTPAQLTAALGKPLPPGNYWAAIDQTDTLNGTPATSAWSAEVPFSIPQPVVTPGSPSAFSVA